MLGFMNRTINNHQKDLIRSDKRWLIGLTIHYLGGLCGGFKSPRQTWIWKMVALEQYQFAIPGHCILAGWCKGHLTRWSRRRYTGRLLLCVAERKVELQVPQQPYLCYRKCVNNGWFGISNPWFACLYMFVMFASTWEDALNWWLQLLW